MNDSGYIPGAGARAPMLERFAKPALKPPENFVGNIVFPDQQVDSFLGLAPITGNEELEVYDDDLAGLKTDFPEVMISEGEYQWELGMHGRKVIIGAVQKMRAQQAAAMARGSGNSGANPMFDLESRLTNVITAQHVRRNEFLKISQLLKTSNYPSGNVLDPIEIDTVTSSAFLQVLAAGAARVEAAGKGPANTIIFGDGAWSGALANVNFTDLLPDTAYKIMTASAFTPILKLPEGASPQVLIASATYKTKKKADPIPMMNLHIWIGRTNPTATGTGDGFGFNFWHPHPENGQQIFVYRLVVGSARNVHISVEGFYRPLVNDGAQGVLLPVTLAA